MGEKLIPYEQALNLGLYMNALGELQAVINVANQRADTMRGPLVGFAKIAGIPLDRADLVVDLPDGPDKRGMVKVTWKEDDDGGTASS